MIILVSEEQIEGLNIALNEAALLGLEVDAHRNIGAATFSVLTLPESGSIPDDRRVQFLFLPIGRVAVSLRNGRWDDLNAQIERVQITNLLQIVESFGGQSLYGWEFFDVPEKNNFEQWANRLSLDFRTTANGFEHTIDLFQESHERILDIRLWFNEFLIKDPDGNRIPLDEFVGNGRRWWDGLFKGDERTKGFGIVLSKQPPTAGLSDKEKMG